MLKRVIGLVFTVVLAVFTLAACDSSDKNTNKLVVGVAAGPYGDMFKQAIAPGLEKQGYQVEIREFSDYVQPNIALANKEIDINLFQHLTYLNNFKKARNLDLTAVAFVPTAGAGFFK